MQLVPFLSLSETAQYQVVYGQGVLVDEIQHYPLQRQLYAVGSFFVEVYSHQDNGLRLYKKIFTNGALLEVYLDKYEMNTKVF